jgi:Na+/proline symporter
LGRQNIIFRTKCKSRTFPILIPQKFGSILISVIVFLGGLSASISMIIISSITLSIMLSNNVIIPYGWIDTFKTKNDTFNNKNIVNIRKVSIFLLIITAFVFYKYLILESSLFSVGLVSFVLIAQLAPSFFGAIFWRRGTYTGALIGLILGILICYINLIIPQYLKAINPELAINQYRILQFFQNSIFRNYSTSFFWSFWQMLLFSPLFR